MTTVLDISADPRRLRGRGALSNASGRYERHARVLMDDGWMPPPPSLEDWPEPSLRTEVLTDSSRTIITKNNSPDISFDQSINPYKGCEHGCIYCFARPTHAYLGLSLGLDFESKLFAKPDAARLLAKELSAPGYVPRVIAMGTNTDPYQPLEKQLRITRSILEVLRDLDILTRMAGRGLVNATISVTTLDPDLARKLEPRAPTPPRRGAARLDRGRLAPRTGAPTSPYASGRDGISGAHPRTRAPQNPQRRGRDGVS